jgi:predicted nucleic acid-binding protein
MPILVDTSVWIDFFRGNRTPQVKRLKECLGREEIVLGDLILAELLQGVRDDEAERIEQAFAAFRVVPLAGESIARRSAAVYRALRGRGITVRKTIDCLIATWCIETHTPLLFSDRDFLPFVDFGLVDAESDTGSPVAPV